MRQNINGFDKVPGIEDRLTVDDVKQLKLEADKLRQCADELRQHASQLIELANEMDDLSADQSAKVKQ
jgi:hypothetical protein